MGLDHNGVPIRRGVPRQLTFDPDAWELLQQLAPTAKSYGRYVSELIRRDAIRRAEWAQRQAGQPPILVEVGADD
jgi:hypothetical protein